MGCEMFFELHKKAALGFSGGVDSSYLLYEGLRCGAEVSPYFVKTPFQPAFERTDAERVCAFLKIPLAVIELDVLAVPEVASNPPDRCYSCKKKIFEAVCARGVADGFDLIIDGTNASDNPADRAGFRAISEMSVRSPLRECGLTKTEIRRLSKKAGLFTWDKPAYACLATRIPTGRTITPALLAKVEASEDALFALGFTDFRVRVLSDETAKLQMPSAQLSQAIERRAEILTGLSPHFASVLLDMEGRA